MHLSSYPFKADSSLLYYEFISTGPAGDIVKGVWFTKLAHNIYNLGFGDTIETTGELDDKSRTNNHDVQKVLATIVKIVDDFTRSHDNVSIIATGNSDSRNRLYRMGISNNLNVITAHFEVFGMKNGFWEPFKKQKEYESFLVSRKKFKFDLWQK